ncbi:MAG: hypothetical protein KJS92_04100 [Bacteroidetes bacterium]|nr:hypothetical protein [Bacteroidota bacterium]
MLRLSAWICLMILGIQAHAQQARRYASVPCQNNWFSLDSLPIVSGSLEVRMPKGTMLPEKQVLLLPGTGKVRMLLSCNEDDTFYCSWLAITAPLHKTIQNLNEQIRQPGLRQDEFWLPSLQQQTANRFIRDGNSGPRVSGVMFRGLNTGNNQDLVPTSGLNLQINGYLAPGIGIEAAMTEQEVPFQPEGSSNSLQDFDRIYLTLNHEGQKLTLGDFPLQDNNGSYFLRYRKKARGVYLENIDSSLGIRASTALSRGRFSRNQIQGTERNQGPYRLTGAAGETPLIVVSGSEVVYLNGQKMERGLNKDYVIDYNIGEITFNPNRIITAFSRILVEFQYSDRNYTRSVSTADLNWKKGAHTYQAGVFSESDLKNQPLLQNLDLFDSSRNLDARSILAEAGNDPLNAVISGIRPLSGFDPSAVNYVLKDSNGTRILVFAPAAEPGRSYFRASFSFVGQGKGNYVAEAGAGNGRIYRWVAPVGSLPSGAYEPVIQLALPVRNTMMQLAQKSDWLPLGNRIKWRSVAEAAASTADKNTFSRIGDSTNNGRAGMLILEGIHRISERPRDSAWTLGLLLKHERVSRQFSAIERFRDVEFERFWFRGLNNPQYKRPDAAEAIWQGQFSLNGSRDFKLQSRLDAYHYTGFTAWRRENSFNWKPGHWSIYAEDARLNGKRPEEENQNSNSKVQGAYRRKSLQSGLNWEQEQNRIRDKNGIIYSKGSYRFNDLAFFFGFEGSKGWKYQAQLGQRIDYGISATNFKAGSSGNSGSLSVRHQKEDGQFWFTQLHRRGLRILDSSLSTAGNSGGNQWMLRSEWLQESSWYRMNGFVQSASGREQRRQFVFVEVPAGQGTYSWIDYNENKIQEQNEFEPAVFRDQARYIRLLLATPEFIASRNNDYTLNAELRFPEQWKRARFLQRFSSSHNLMFSGKNNNSNLLRSLVPEALYRENRPGNYFSGRALYRHSLFYNRNEGKLSLEYTYQRNETQALVSNGTDSRRNTRHLSTLRFMPQGSWLWNQFLEIGNTGSYSAFYRVNNYAYRFRSIEEKITFNGWRNFRLSLNGKAAPFTFSDSSGRKGLTLDAGTEWQMGLFGSSNLEASCTYSKVRFDGDASGPAAFDVLRGLQPGNNLRWNLALRMKTGNHVQIDLGYEGRKIPNFRTIHNARVEARYLF